MRDNFAYQEEVWEEMIAGKIFLMSPCPTIKHMFITGNIFNIFSNYLNNKKCTPIQDGFYLRLNADNLFKPDFMVVCDADKIREDAVYGAPDLVVEVLSPSTARNDRFRKKDVYEACGVREYWLVNPADKTLEQYILTDGKFIMHELYAIHPDYVLEKMSEEERAAFPPEFKCSLYDDLVIKLKDVFYRVK